MWYQTPASSKKYGLNLRDPGVNGHNSIVKSEIYFSIDAKGISAAASMSNIYERNALFIAFRFTFANVLEMSLEGGECLSGDNKSARYFEELF